LTTTLGCIVVQAIERVRDLVLLDLGQLVNPAADLDHGPAQVPERSDTPKDFLSSFAARAWPPMRASSVMVRALDMAIISPFRVLAGHPNGAKACRSSKALSCDDAP
jgi:hypothetical protein